MTERLSVTHSLAPWKKSYDKPKQYIKNQRLCFADEGLSSQSYGFSISHVRMWKLNCKENWALKNQCFWTVLLEKTLRVPWTARSYQSVLKEIDPEYSLKRLMLRLKLQYFGHLMQRADSLEKTLMLGKIEGKRRGDDRGWDAWMAWVGGLNGYEFKQAPGVSDGQGSLACCGPWGRKESDMTEWLNSSSN